MRQSLFSKTWNKALRKAKNTNDIKPLTDDIGGLKGIFQFTSYDPLTNKILFVSKKQNTLVNQSKSNLIRLISQSTSPWIGSFDPADLAIKKMRFGNAAEHTTPSRLNYYKINEQSTRSNTPLKQTGNPNPSFAGGKKSQETIPGESGTVDTILDAYNSNWTPGPDSTKIYKIPTLDSLTGYINPPSHGTLRVEFYKANVLIETLDFGADGSDYVYTRSKIGVPPTKITTETGKEPIVTPDDVNRSGGGFTDINGTNASACGTRVFYDYTSGNSGWKLKVEEIAGLTLPFDKIIFRYDIGKYNVINSIVPKEGYNSGSGITELDRYQGNTDWYPIVGNSEYRDSSDDFIDDFSVTFSVNMTGNYGNGDTDVNLNEYIKYSEAFLFNGVDEMFSAVSLPNPFDKNETSAYFISWTILAPIN